MAASGLDARAALSSAFKPWPAGAGHGGHLGAKAYESLALGAPGAISKSPNAPATSEALSYFAHKGFNEPPVLQNPDKVHAAPPADHGYVLVVELVFESGF